MRPRSQQTPAWQDPLLPYHSGRPHRPQQTWTQQLPAHREAAFGGGDLTTQQMAARAQVGAVVLPTLVGDHDPLLVKLPTATDGPLRDIWLTVYPDMRRSPLVKVVMEFLVGCIEGERPLRR